MSPNRLRKTISAGLVILIAIIITLHPQQIVQAAGVIGTGTPGSCTGAAFETALTGGGTITFNCGAAPHTIILTSYKLISDNTEIQGGRSDHTQRRKCYFHFHGFI